MRRKQEEWDVEVTFDATYFRRPGEYTPYVARAYPRGSRTLAWMLEEAETEDGAVAAIEERIRAYLTSDSQPEYPRTYRVDKKGMRLL